jgi:acetyl-CoA synthetase
MIANLAAMDIRPGSMGRPLPGIDVAIVRHTGDGTIEVVETPDTEGELALRPGWPSMFRSYLSDEERYRKCFVGGYYLTGDLAKRDRDGYYWFIGRADDVIKSSGHLIGPFEVESVLLEHPSVAEVGVIRAWRRRLASSIRRRSRWLDSAKSQNDPGSRRAGLKRGQCSR